MNEFKKMSTVQEPANIDKSITSTFARVGVMICLFVSFPLTLYDIFDRVFGVYLFEIAVVYFSVVFLSIYLISLNKLKYKLSDFDILLVSMLGATLIAGVFNSLSSDLILMSLYSPLIMLLSKLFFGEKANIRYLLLTIVGLWIINLIAFYSRYPNFNVVGIMGNRNWASGLATSLAPCVLHLMFSSKLSEKVKYSLMLLSSVLTMFVVYKTGCRASIVAILAMIAFLVYSVVRTKKLYVILAALFSLVGLFGAYKSGASSENIRLDIWASTLDMIIDNPMGVGSGQFDRKFQNYVTDSQKSKLVSADTTQHPHNEILFQMVENGVIVGLLWLFVTIKIVATQFTTGIYKALQLTFISLVVHGSLDKLLFIQPTGLIFLLLISTLYQQKALKSLRLPAKRIKNLLCLVVIFFSLYFGIKETLSSWYFRQGKMASAREESNEAYSYFEKSISLKTGHDKAHYESLLVSLFKLDDLNLAGKHIDHFDQSHPLAGDFQLLKALYFEKKAREDHQNLEKYLNKSLEALNLACSHNITDINSFTQRFEFAAKYLDHQNMEQIYSELRSVYALKFEKLQKYWNKDKSQIVKEWINSGTFGKRLKVANLIVSSLKYSQLDSLLYPQKYNQLKQIFGSGLSIADMHFATDAYKLYLDFKGLEEKEILEMISTEVKVLNNDGFDFPQNTWNMKEGSLESIKALKAFALSLKGNIPFHINGLKESTFYFKENDLFEFTNGDLKQIEPQSIILHKDIEFFFYPQAFFYKNELLSHCLSSTGELPDYCISPSIIYREIKKLLPGVKIQISEAPFQKILQP